MSEEKLLIDAELLIQKFPGKGGWTYVALPGLKGDNANPFGWRQVRGRIDQYELKQYKLMPMGNGSLFLPIKAQIRKFIKKGEGDKVRVQIFEDFSAYQVPDEILSIFELIAPELQTTFLQLKGSEQKAYIDWIYEAKSMETKDKRVDLMLKKLTKGLKHHQSLESD